MRSRLRFIRAATVAGWQRLVEVSNHIGAALILLALVGVSVFSGWTLPHWWLGALILIGCYGLLLFEGAHQITREIERLRDGRASAALVLGTELNDIRHKIEVVRSNTPPQYGPAFRLSGSAWAEFDSLLAKWPELYALVGNAYTAADHVNEALDTRRGVVGSDVTLGVIPDDGLDAAYEAAGTALDVLEVPRREPWESAKAKAVRQVAKDMMKELTPEEEAAELRREALRRHEERIENESPRSSYDPNV